MRYLISALLNLYEWKWVSASASSSRIYSTSWICIWRLLATATPSVQKLKRNKFRVSFYFETISSAKSCHRPFRILTFSCKKTFEKENVSFFKDLDQNEYKMRKTDIQRVVFTVSVLTLNRIYLGIAPNIIPP